MAVSLCKECSKEVGDTEKTCPYCGAKIPKNNGLLVKVIIGLFVLGILGAIFSRFGKTPAQPQDSQPAPTSAKQKAAEEVKARADKLNLARSACERFAKKTLRDPSSAEFEDSGTYWAKEIKPDTYRVQVRFRAKNDANAMAQKVVDCVVQGKGGSWVPLSMQESPV